MNDRIYQFFTTDHRRIEDLLKKATRDLNDIQMDFYHQFRTGLLTHIKMEEKILFKAAQVANGKSLPLAAQLRIEHGALTALMVVPPSPEVIKVINHVMEQHDILEEEKGGMYEACEKLTQDQTEVLIHQLQKVTEVPVHPHNKADYALGAAKRALERAGYDFDAIAAR